MSPPDIFCKIAVLEILWMLFEKAYMKKCNTEKVATMEFGVIF